MMNKSLVLLLLFVLGLKASTFGDVPADSVTVSVTETDNTSDLPDRFLGLSYETSMLLPENGKYYFDPKDQALIQTFQTLGIKSLRIGANAVDDPLIAVPQEKDLDVFFAFARAAGVKVIYSFRLKNGNPADSARLAGYIAAHDGDVLDCFAIGNEPDGYLKTYDAYFAAWKPHYDAILQAVPEAMFDGPCINSKKNYVLALAKAMSADRHLAMASDHYYFLGAGRKAEENLPPERARFLSDNLHQHYKDAYVRTGAVLAAEGVPYRMDEINSYSGGGARNLSDTYASTLWALDCTHWWAARHILGMNYHTGTVKILGQTVPANYAAFVSSPDGHGYDMRPQAYALQAFSQGAHGRPLTASVEATTPLDFDAYAYRAHDGSLYVTLINKSYGDKAQAASVSLQLPAGAGAGPWQRMDLSQKDSDVAAKDGVTLGGSSIDTQGKWSGNWNTLSDVNSTSLTVVIAPASASIFHIPVDQ
jgi:hypothetical protein